MTSKDKAKELVEKFVKCQSDDVEWMERAKQCALICVEEILSMGWEVIKFHTIKNYWEEVKQEIEKL